MGTPGARVETPAQMEFRLERARLERAAHLMLEENRLEGVTYKGRIGDCIAPRTAWQYLAACGLLPGTKPHAATTSGHAAVQSPACEEARCGAAP